MNEKLRAERAKEILCLDSKASPITVKKYYLDSLAKMGLVSEMPSGEKIAYCAITKEPYSLKALDLDHINGDHNDSRVENLRLVHTVVHRTLRTTGGNNVHRYNTRASDGKIYATCKKLKDGTLKGKRGYASF